MPIKQVDVDSNLAVPTEYSGKWVAWNSDHSQIVAERGNLAELWRVAREQGIEDPVFEKVPRADVRFVGVR